ncbi:unnamed protein product, partial [Chrysoparadoxa australica]
GEAGEEGLRAALGRGALGAFVVWVKAGHELRQERRRVVVDLLRVLVSSRASLTHLPGEPQLADGPPLPEAVPVPTQQDVDIPEEPSGTVHFEEASLVEEPGTPLVASVVDEDEYKSEQLPTDGGEQPAGSGLSIVRYASRRKMKDKEPEPGLPSESHWPGRARTAARCEGCSRSRSPKKQKGRGANGQVPSSMKVETSKGRGKGKGESKHWGNPGTGTGTAPNLSHEAAEETSQWPWAAEITLNEAVSEFEAAVQEHRRQRSWRTMDEQGRPHTSALTETIHDSSFLDDLGSLEALGLQPLPSHDKLTSADDGKSLPASCSTGPTEAGSVATSRSNTSADLADPEEGRGIGMGKEDEVESSVQPTVAGEALP